MFRNIFFCRLELENIKQEVYREYFTEFSTH